MNKLKLMMIGYILLGGLLSAYSAWRIVVVDDTQPPPWFTIASPMGVVTNPVGADINGNLKNATNFNNIVCSNLWVISTSSTNGAVYIATNTLGQGRWSAPAGFWATLSENFYFSNATPRTVDVWNTETFDYGNTFDGKNFVAPVNGFYGGIVSFDTFFGKTNAVYSLAIQLNGVSIDNVYFYSPTNNVTIAIPLPYYYLTNGSIICTTVTGPTVSTNYINSSAGSRSFFGFGLLREIP